MLDGCLKEIAIEKLESEQEIVVYSFFTESLPWSVDIYKTYDFNESKFSEPVENARVSITGDDSPILLEHAGDGVYVANSYPEIGVDYTLNVEIEGHDNLYAQSVIPDKSEISEVITNRTLRTVVTNYGTYSEMVSAGFSITPPLNTSSLCRVRVLKFDSTAGFNRYCFNESSFAEMLKNGVEQKVIIRLKTLTGQIVFGPLWDVLIPVLGEVKASENLKKIENATFLDQVDYRDPKAFSMQTCIAQAGLFYQAPYETFSLLGKFSEKTSVNIFTNGFYDEEYWIEYMDLSNEYYKFQKDYSLQISNRGDVSGAPVLVYSNITNGVGIFAGYQKQMVRIDNF